MELHEFVDLLRDDQFSKKIIQRFDKEQREIKDFNDFDQSLRKTILNSSSVNPLADDGFRFILTLAPLRAFVSNWNPEFLGYLKTIISNQADFEKRYSQLFDKENAADVFVVMAETYTDAVFNMKIQQRSVVAEQSKNKIEWSHGDVFRFKREDNYFVFGRILLKVKNCFKGKKLDDKLVGLMLFEDSYLIQLYTQFSTESHLSSREVALHGLFCTEYAFSSGFIEKVDAWQVDPKEIDFPELFIFDGDKMKHFAKGELLWKMNTKSIGDVDYDYYAERMINLNSYDLDNYLLFALGKTEMIDYPYPIYDLARYDLRFRKDGLREKVYGLINENPAAGYFDMAAKYKIETKNYFK